MLFKNITIIDSDMCALEGMYVGTLGDTIAYIGDEMPRWDFKEIYDGTGKLLIPAFTNAHTHLPMSILKGIGGGSTLNEWLTKHIFPFESNMTGEDIYWSTLLGICEMVRFGCVSATEMYYHGEQMVKAVIESGVKANLSLATLCFTDQDLYDLPIYAESKALFEKYMGETGNKINIDMCIHGEYTSSEKVVRQMAEYAFSIGARMHIHLSETITEFEGCFERHGKSPAQYFYDLGVFDCPTTAAHCVWLDESDYPLLAQKRVTVATCPISNLKLSSGVCDVHSLMDSDINIALGTDSVASNNSLDMIEEMKIFAILHNLTPEEALFAATKAGALSQGRKNTGAIVPGNKADLAVVNLSGVHNQPINSVIDNLVYSSKGTDICLTMSDGKVLYKDGVFTTIDIDKVLHHTEKSRNRILNELNK